MDNGAFSAGRALVPLPKYSFKGIGVILLHSKTLLIIKQRTSYLLEKYLSGKSIHYQQVLALALPIFLEQAFILGINFFNTALISTAGVAAISAVNMVDSLNLLMTTILVAVATGGTVVVAQYQGSRNQEMVSRSTEQTVAAVPLLALGLGLVLILFRDPILWLLFGSADADVFSNSRLYLLGSVLSYPAFGLYQGCVCCLRGVGRTRPALALTLITNVSYVLLNLLFISVFHWGVIGMAVAVNIARGLGAVCSLLFLTRLDDTLHFEYRGALRLNKDILRRIMYIGLPFAAEQVFFNGGKLLTQTYIVALGTLAITANAIVWSIIMVLQIPSNTISQVAVTIIGQCMGRRQVDDSRKFIRTFVILSSICYLIMLLVVQPLLPGLIGVFNPPEQIIPEIRRIVIVTAIAMPFVWSLSFIIPASIRAAGDAKFSSVVSLCCMWTLRVAGGWLLAIPFGLGLIGIYVAMILEWTVRSGIFLFRVKGNKWYAHHLID